MVAAEMRAPWFSSSALMTSIELVATSSSQTFSLTERRIATARRWLIVRHRTISHRLAVAMRRSVSEKVCDELVATNSIDVIKALLENHGARISAATMNYLVDQSKTLDVYQE